MKVFSFFFLFLLPSICIANNLVPHHTLLSVFINGELSTSKVAGFEATNKDDIVLFVDPGKLPANTTITYHVLFEGDTINTKYGPLAILNDLTIGTYHFNFQLINPNWKEPKQFSVPIKIHRSFENSWWYIPLFVVYLTLLLFGASFFVRLSNSRNRERLFDLRNDWTNKLHNDIGGDLSSASLRMDILNRSLKDLDEKSQERISKIYSILLNIQKKLRFVFDLVDPKKDSFEVMVKDIKDFAEQNFKLKNITFSFDNQYPAGDHKLNISRVNKLYLVLKEGINNSVKYSKASWASLKIFEQKNGLVIILTDNGIGFDLPQAIDNGNGIANLKQYAKEGFMDLDIVTAPDQGTTIKAYIPYL